MSAANESSPQPAPRQVTPGRARLFRIIMLSGLLIVFVFMAIGAELGARYYERRRSTAPDYVPSIYYPHRRLRYGLKPDTDYYGWFKINSLGLRGREVTVAKRQDVTRILCFGASTTFDIAALGADRPWPEILEAELRRLLGTTAIEVLNLGIPGATSLDSLIDLQMRGIAFQPDIVIVYQGHNDFVYSIPPPSRSTAQPTLFPLEDAPRGSFERWLTNHSLLYAKTEGRIAALFGGFFSVFQRDERVPTSAQERERGIAEGLAIYRANMRSIAAIASANHIELVLPKLIVPLPAGPTSDCTTCNTIGDAYGGLSVEQVRSWYGSYNSVLQEIGNTPGVRFVQTDGFVPSADRYYHDPVHFGPEGSKLMGEKLAVSMAPIVRAAVESRKAQGATPASDVVR